MSLHEKLRHHLAGKDVSIVDEGPLAVASWQEDGARMLVALPGALTADAVIDAHVRAQAARATLMLASEGAPTPVARRMAERYGIALLDLAGIALPEPVVVAPPAPPTLALPAPEPTLALPAFEAELEALAVAEAAPLVAPTHLPASAPAVAAEPAPAAAPEVAPAALPEVAPAVAAEPAPAAAPEVAPAAVAEVAPAVAPAAVPDVSPAPEPAPSPVLPSEPSTEGLVVAESLPEPELAHGDLRLPWDPSEAVAEPTPMHVEPIELLSMPWAHEIEDHHEVIESGRSTRHAPDRPTLNPGWGLPWPRPVPSMDGVAIADPKVWGAPERIMAVRQDLDRIGAPSFGVAKPEGSQWLKRLSEFPERP